MDRPCSESSRIGPVSAEVGKGEPKTFQLTLLTSDTRLAREADRAGVTRIGVDLESLGKAERQAGHDTRLSKHGWTDLQAICAVLDRANAFVRINPLHEGTRAEIETALSIGAGVIMLPYFSTSEQVETFVDLVGGRARTIALVETVASLFRLREILDRSAIDEIMIGLNDLRLEAKLSPFEILTSPILDAVAAEVRRSGTPLSIGGVARLGDLSRPFCPELVLAQYARLGSTGSWLSRSFFKDYPPELPLARAVAEIRACMMQWADATTEQFETARTALRARIDPRPA
jgi:citrate lyase beta subunit